MAELRTMAVHSPKNPAHRWLINVDDFDPAVYQVWGKPEPSTAVGPLEVQAQEELVMPDEPDWIDSPTRDIPGEPATEPVEMAHRNIPSVPDFVEDEQGDVIAVTIIDPERRNARKEIPFEDYDPDQHELWSSHPRFNR